MKLKIKIRSDELISYLKINIIKFSNELSLIHDVIHIDFNNNTPYEFIKTPSGEVKKIPLIFKNWRDLAWA